MSFWRRGQEAGRPSIEGGEHCDLCGQVVVISPEGRCRLGHRVGTPLGALGEPETDGSAIDDFAGFTFTDPMTEPDADPLTAAELFADAGQGYDLAMVGAVAPSASRDAVSPPAHETSEVRSGPAPHPYDELLGWDDQAGAPADWPASQAPSPYDALRSELDVPAQS